MARYHYTGLTTGEEEGFTPQFPCTLLIYPDTDGGLLAQSPGSGEYGSVFIEVKKENGRYHRFDALRYRGETIERLDLPGTTIRVAAFNLTGATVEVIDSAPEPAEPEKAVRRKNSKPVSPS